MLRRSTLHGESRRAVSSKIGIEIFSFHTEARGLLQ